ncbi:MAG: HesA/MoeB/ThiF family protein [Candidatus Azosocius agrarius]|nr:MAG: HesA/MoeB/ThiF family protein [Gammaproteobacteria bacterium]
MNIDINIFGKYNKQIIIPEFGIESQKKLLESRVLCVGAGGLGSTLLMYLVSAGIGTIGIVEIDKVDFSNLHRQPLYNTNDIGKNKIDSAYNFLNKLNPDINIIKFNNKLLFSNAYNIMKDFDIVVDCTDNLESKLLINEYAFILKIPMIYGAALGFEGYVAIFDTLFGACLRCLYYKYPVFGVKNCNDDGVIGPIPGIIGCLQALECIKLILHKNKINKFVPLMSKILFINGVDSNIKIYNIKKNNECDICSVLSKNILIFNNLIKFSCVSYNFVKINYNNLYIFDIREKDEYKKSHILGALNISFYLFYLFVSFLHKKLSYNCNILIYCGSDAKSIISCKLCNKYLYFNVYYLQKGYNNVIF